MEFHHIKPSSSSLTENSDIIFQYFKERGNSYTNPSNAPVEHEILKCFSRRFYRRTVKFLNFSHTHMTVRGTLKTTFSQMCIQPKQTNSAGSLTERLNLREQRCGRYMLQEERSLQQQRTVTKNLSYEPVKGLMLYTEPTEGQKTFSSTCFRSPNVHHSLERFMPSSFIPPHPHPCCELSSLLMIHLAKSKLNFLLTYNFNSSRV